MAVNFFFCLMTTASSPSSSRKTGIPYYSGAFAASGEFVRANFVVNGVHRDYELSVFEELYDSIEKKATFRVTKNGDVMTYVQDFRTKRNYLIRTYDGITTCVDVPEANFTRREFVTVVSAPDERIYFFLRDLLVLKSYVKVQTRVDDLVRGQSCRIRGFHTSDHEIRGTMTWTLNNSTMRDLKRPPAGITDLPVAMKLPRNATLEVPLQGHFIFRRDGFSEESITMNILNFEFIGKAIRNNLFEVPDGVRCEGNRKSGLAHPVYYNMRVFSYSARVKSSTSKHTRIINGFIDVNRNLHRLDYKAWNNPSSIEQTVIFSGKEGMAYHVTRSGACSAGNITDVDFDKQMIMLPRFMEKLSPKTFFAGNSSATIAYKKIAVKGGIPCHVWDIVRFDWPSNGLKTLWEWCFVDKSYFAPSSETTSSHIVSLDIHVLELPQAPFYGLVPGEKLSFQFFDINKETSELVELQGFDITPCYQGSSSLRKLVLTLEEKAGSEAVYKKPSFIFAAQKAVTNVGKVPVLHVKVATNDQLNFADRKRMVTFTLLGSINGIPSIQLDSAVVLLQQAISRKSLKVFHEKEFYVVEQLSLF
ncbi:uncharacterized protein LOC119456850 isoform X1 [Dermacentor silvarum]|uniref:uncharacterized protein LOC119456850 isoform X1 n=1 Tax=Dermacentor silvarum TaxID=543639 RepID=UPI002101740E|nr:uncharacterized protein LOC119456850 isoform X1 [Dermacentor silvarum]